MVKAIWEFLTFRRMLGPFILQIMFWALALVLVGFGLSELQSGHSFTGLMVIVFGVLGLRIVFELTLLAFRMYDRLGQIKSVLESVDEATKPIVMVDTDDLKPDVE